MQTFKVTLAFLFTLGFVQTASASVLDGSGQQLQEYATGQELLHKLDSPNASDRASGMFYVLGLLDGFQVGSKAGDRLSVCLVPPLTVEDLTGAVKKYLHDNPSALTEPVTINVIIALHKRWPCK